MQWMLDTCNVARAIKSMIKAAGKVTPKMILKTARPLIIKMTSNPMKIQRVDQICTVLSDIMPSTPASSVFNLKPAGTPINHTQPERNNLFIISSVKLTTQKLADSA